VTIDPSVDIAWAAASDGSGSGVAGYSVEFSQSSATTPDATADTTALTATSSELEEGWWYAHVRAIDGAGNAGSASHTGRFWVGVEATGCELAGRTVLGSSGTIRADRVIGTSGVDALRGSSGADTLVGGGGVDRLYGGRGNDTLCLGAGNDYGYGEAGADRILGSTGADTINPGSGRDVVLTGTGRDIVYAFDHSRDVIICGAGTDTVVIDAIDRVLGCERVTIR
jgi:hypothetical protein